MDETLQYYFLILRCFGRTEERSALGRVCVRECRRSSSLRANLREHPGKNKKHAKIEHMIANVSECCYMVRNKQM